MKYSVKFLALAQDELDDIFQAYQYQNADLATQFMTALSTTLIIIKDYPNIGMKSSEHTQRFLIKGFPYAILFHNHKEYILIIAIMNLHKKPIHWATKSISEYSTCRISILPETMYIR